MLFQHATDERWDFDPHEFLELEGIHRLSFVEVMICPEVADLGFENRISSHPSGISTKSIYISQEAKIREINGEFFLDFPNQRLLRLLSWFHPATKQAPHPWGADTRLVVAQLKNIPCTKEEDCQHETQVGVA